MACSARPGSGRVRVTEPTARTSSSYSSPSVSPPEVATVATRPSRTSPVSDPVTTRTPASADRSGTTTWEGLTVPAAVSGSSGW